MKNKIIGASLIFLCAIFLCFTCLMIVYNRPVTNKTVDIYVHDLEFNANVAFRPELYNNNLVADNGERGPFKIYVKGLLKTRNYIAASIKLSRAICLINHNYRFGVSVDYYIEAKNRFAYSYLADFDCNGAIVDNDISSSDYSYKDGMSANEKKSIDEMWEREILDTDQSWIVHTDSLGTLELPR